ncbi:MAG: SLBB domain-containing protein [Limnochordaceae bacterium]|nr:SLBB domain-containing protein [Limnochordaceae bacterium]
MRPGMTLQDLVALAGGLTQDADAGRATLSRTLADGTRQAIPVDLTGIVDPHSGVPVPPVALQPGDTLVVPGVVRQVAVMGEVARPGLVPYRPGLTLAEALAAAGGPTEQAELGRVSLTRRAREAQDGAAPAIELDLSSLGRQTSAGATLVAAPAGAGMLLQPGDLVLVPRAQREVFVLGAVERPGSYPVRPGARVLDALAMAGGPRSDGEAVATLLSRPDGGHRTIDVERLVRDPASPDNVPLQPGDLLYIPPLRQVLVLGEVGRPGAYVPPPGARILDLLALAGGVRPDVAVTDIILTRGVRGASAAAVSPAPPDAAGSVPAAAGRPAATQPQADGPAPLVYHLDYERLVSGQLPESNMPVQDGDVLYVPATRRDVLVMGEVQRPGLYVLPSPGPVRLLDVLALAGDPPSGPCWNRWASCEPKALRKRRRPAAAQCSSRATPRTTLPSGRATSWSSRRPAGPIGARSSAP